MKITEISLPKNCSLRNELNYITLNYMHITHLGKVCSFFLSQCKSIRDFTWVETYILMPKPIPKILSKVNNRPPPPPPNKGKGFSRCICIQEYSLKPLSRWYKTPELVQDLHFIEFLNDALHEEIKTGPKAFEDYRIGFKPQDFFCILSQSTRESGGNRCRADSLSVQSVLLGSNDRSNNED